MVGSRDLFINFGIPQYLQNSNKQQINLREDCSSSTNCNGSITQWKQHKGWTPRFL